MLYEYYFNSKAGEMRLPMQRSNRQRDAQYIMAKQHFKLIAPVSGKTIHLDQVPDPIFSERLTGDGLAVLTDSAEVLAPCDGEITLFFETKHAFAITTEDGIQVLVHIGLDTILLNGEGITALHKRGDHVKAGTPILRLNLDVFRQHNINLISPVLVVNQDKVTGIFHPDSDSYIEAGKDTILEFAI